MTDGTKSAHLAQREDGSYVAASATSPYFCFEAETEVAVKQKVEAALAAYTEAKKSARSHYKLGVGQKR